LLQRRGDEPRGQICRAVHDRGAPDLRAKKPMRESQGTGDPIRGSLVAPETTPPVEIRLARFQGRGYVTEPKRTPGPVPQQVKG
jgi:hypothetical protein